MNVKDRRRHQFRILRSWHGALVAGGVDTYSFRDAVDDYRRSALLCIAYAVAGTELDRANDRGRSLAHLQAVRTFAAALDLDAQTLLPRG